MTASRDQVAANRRLRDAARAIVEADVRHVKADLAAKSVGGRVVARLSDGANEVYEEAIEVAADNKGALAAIVAALALWFARNPIRDAFAAITGD